MMKRLPLPPEIEDALDALQMTRSLAEGEAAAARLQAHFSRYAWLDWTGLAPVFLALTALFFRDQPWGDALFVFACILGIGNVFLLQTLRRRWSLDRAEEALNRWRQIAGTLAVTGSAP